MRKLKNFIHFYHHHWWRTLVYSWLKRCQPSGHILKSSSSNKLAFLAMETKQFQFFWHLCLAKSVSIMLISSKFFVSTAKLDFIPYSNFKPSKQYQHQLICKVYKIYKYLTFWSKWRSVFSKCRNGCNSKIILNEK